MTGPVDAAEHAAEALRTVNHLTTTAPAPRTPGWEDLGDLYRVLGELRVPINETAVYRAAAICRLHAACPVPSAILKAIEVSAGLALPADVHVSIET